ncbi:phospholipid/cholesterol/gamma-HCH transport system permease protein [Rhodopseudomonas rhenobacensis]|uniref:Phospholipid/cholesterol/gamma-HCH transport system permease protein n=1 Tax=Rhodopseudomonas rhenobacensis TaxID=87461 RepID=A0A7W8E1I6_9BRAD|nr:MlaE family lipid ABC transporter permease subunit [Rhodopseudomonas rhenobacensis]MBB5049910.1 phospholipid/cholesterol/gamma-HCH transport system permease protein [Rhodopseudomonas rhenobacensis]
MSSQPLLNTISNGDALLLRPTGEWTAVNAAALEHLFDGIAPQLRDAKALTIDLAELQEIDTLGAWLLEKISRRAAQAGRPAELVGVADRYAGLIDQLRQVNRRKPSGAARGSLLLARLEDIGRATWGAREDLFAFLQMLGALANALLGVLRRPRSLRLTSLVYQIYRVGWQAIPIIGLITFLIGAIIAQQGIFHFRKFGAESYVVDMVGILVLRELGVLIVAIMVAGRSGSAYTAELGSMKMREEIDALSTMDLDPVEVLILPRVIALVVALPILAFLGSMAALYGGGLVAWFYGGMSPTIFIARLHEAVSVTHFEVGIIKAPFMALVIGIVACSEGLRVKGSAESLGRQTTTSVVKSIFCVIVLDGLFAVFFASIGM